MRIYLDVCCLNRPFNDQTQQRIRLESEAVRSILTRVHAGEFLWISSDAVRFEISQNRNEERRSKIMDLTLAVHETLRLSPAVLSRAESLQADGLKPLDALHLSFAEAGKCDILFTTDDRFGRWYSRLEIALRVRVVNPAAWILEAADDR